ncbi:type VII secretion-associated serine protease mycosin [Streptomyces sp. NBC_01537]|uniref:type VII secretion-associated serine protease mycosin n=1 Tax=Streptomyces sp. NBC_01537 TaxID=2903896 RepID=UPI003870B412
MGSRAAQSAATALCALSLVGLSGLAVATPAAADTAADDPSIPIANASCNFAGANIAGTPWSLQRLLLDEMWENSRGAGVKVAVIDTGVDNDNTQLRQAIDPDVRGKDYITPGGDGTDDPVGHGTKVAGIIAARPIAGTGFVGIAPQATIIPIRQNDAEGSGTAGTMADAIDYAAEHGADVINISQDTSQALQPGSDLEKSVEDAINEGVVVVAAAGNDGASGQKKLTYPASFPGVLAVAASDRNNERASFSQPGDFVGVAAPGVDMVSTVPKGGQCIDNGTSFAAPYVAGVVALVRSKYPKWTPAQVIARIEQTAERTEAGHNALVGWGVVDPVAALTDDAPPSDKATEDPQSTQIQNAGNSIVPGVLTIGETAEERNTRYGIYVVGGGVLIIAVVVGSGIAMRDWRRKHPINTHGEAL